MKKNKLPRKEELVAFRVTKSEVQSIDFLAKLIGESRSGALRRLVPNLNGKKNLSTKLGA